MKNRGLRNPKTRAPKVLRNAWPRVREIRNKDQVVYMVDSRQRGFVGGRRLFFNASAEALATAESIAHTKARYGAAAFGELSTRQRLDAREALGLLAAFPGVTLSEAARHYIEYAHAQAARTASLSVEEAIDAYLDSKRAERDRGDITNLTFIELNSKLRIVKRHFAGYKVAEIDRPVAETFINGLPHAARGRFNIRMKFLQFLNFALRQGWITSNPVAGIKVRVRREDVHVLSVEEVTKLLRVCETSESGAVVLPYVLVSLFGGLRPGEAEALRWEQIHFESRQIEVLASTSKTRETRFVQMEQMLIEWLLPFRKPQGRIIGINFKKTWKKIREAAGLRGADGDGWVKDTLRHCYGTFWLPIHQNRAQLAELMGNSLQVIKAHYKRAVLPEVARAFWALRPRERSSVVVPFSRAS